MALTPRVSIVVVNWNGGRYVEAALESLERAGGDHEIVVIDNASSDGSPERIRDRFPRVRLEAAGSNLGFAAGNNLGARLATGELLVLFNPDAFATPGWLEPLVAAFDDPAVAIASPKIYRGLPGESTTFDSAGCDLEFPLGEGPPRGYLQRDAGQFDAPADVAYASGAVFAVRPSVYEALGGLDESFFAYAEESDFCWRARMDAWRCRYVPASLAYHLGSVSLGARSDRKLYLQTRNRIRMCLQNYAFANLVRFVVTEVLHGLAVIGATAFFPGYRSLGAAYLRAWGSVLASLPAIVRTRRRRQRDRVLSDREVLALHRRVGLLATLRRYRTLTTSGSASLFNPAPDLP